MGPPAPAPHYPTGRRKRSVNLMLAGGCVELKGSRIYNCPDGRQWVVSANWKTTMFCSTIHANKPRLYLREEEPPVLHSPCTWLATARMGGGQCDIMTISFSLWRHLTTTRLTSMLRSLLASPPPLLFYHYRNVPASSTPTCRGTTPTRP